MPKPKITLFVDVVSPFGYMGFYALRNFPIFKQCEINYIPIFLGGLMKACNNAPPISIKNKGEWIGLERLRWARKFDIPMTEQVPEGFPAMTLSVQRALTALSTEKPEVFEDVLAAMFHAHWVEGQPMQKPEVAAACFAKALGGSAEIGKAALEKGSTPEAKKMLSKNTDFAFEKGAFGLPWFVATNSNGKEEGFWGFDRIGQLVDFLELERPDGRAWKAML